jgi:hypothetical protein
MKITAGLIVVGLSMVFFYLRVAFLRGRKKRYEREFALKRRRVNGRSKGAALPQRKPGSPPFGIKSWIITVISILMIVFGLLLYNKMFFLSVQLISNATFINTFSPYWYIVVAAGVVVLSFCFKIDKPDLGDDKS